MLLYIIIIANNRATFYIHNSALVVKTRETEEEQLCIAVLII